MTTVLISAGDASGDLHAAGFARAFRERHPEARLIGLGGEAMRRAGVDVRVDARALATGGFLELFTQLPRIVSVWWGMNRLLREADPDLVVLVDSGGFNIPFARRVRRRSRARILYYVAPQVWAWRKGRVGRMARRVDEVAVIFPFEPDVYAARGARATFVGHPLVDEVSRGGGDALRRAHGVAPGEKVIAVLPGSRRNEVTRQLPIQLAACRVLAARVPGLRVWVVRAPSIEPDDLERAVAGLEGGSSDGCEFVDLDARDAMRASDVVLAKPGTVTLEAALIGRPMVVVASVHPLTALIVSRLVALPHYAMPNLIEDAPVVPEFVQEEADPEAIADALEALFEGQARDAQCKALDRVAARLGAGGAAGRACDLAEKLLVDPA
ncbi:MAG: lipid-A-disaccharide synthase [Myxococcota bacterium]|jgi:lipid-A-disaccharide synthase|nr:lipid-A-disaccharide synthase [Myxococcota bacterium]